MLIDPSDDSDDTIYYNVDALNHNTSDVSHSSRVFREEDLDEPWGVYPFKPVAQTDWCTRVSSACVAAAEVEVDHDPALTSDLRPRVFDHNARTWLLLDIGAAVSCYPASAFPGAKADPSKVLQAVNGAKIPTFGSRKIKINLGGRTYTHDFILAQI